MRTGIAMLAALVLFAGDSSAQNTVACPVADGFDFPVGPPDADKYYKSRGFRANHHMGDDWNGVRGGDSDLGDPIFATAHGIVVYARDAHMGWGNVVIIRHAFFDGGKLVLADSLYGHLQAILVREGQRITRGQQIGKMGNNHGMYDAHLHFEIRKNLNIGIYQTSFARDFSNYYDPTSFVAGHRKLSAPSRTAAVPISIPLTVPQGPNRTLLPTTEAGSPQKAPAPTPRSNGFRVNRYEDLGP